MDFEKDLGVHTTNIPGLLLFDLSVHGDGRGWFKENWQRAKMLSLGLPDFMPVQNNISFNAERGVTRGIHAEPWDKYIGIATGSVFGAWVDLRPGVTFGEVFTCVLDPSKAIYVPRGVGNSFQALEDGTAYTYLVNAHWSAQLKSTYTFVNLADPALGIQWPIPLSECELSEADKCHPPLSEALPMSPRRTLVIGSETPAGLAIKKLVEEQGISRSFVFHHTDYIDAAYCDTGLKIDLSSYCAVINCSNCASVDDGATGPDSSSYQETCLRNSASLARACSEQGVNLMHLAADSPHVFPKCGHELAEVDHLCSASERATYLAVSVHPRSYIVRACLMKSARYEIDEAAKHLARELSTPVVPIDLGDGYSRDGFYRAIASKALSILGYRDGDVEPSCPASFGVYCVGARL